MCISLKWIILKRIMLEYMSTFLFYWIQVVNIVISMNETNRINWFNKSLVLILLWLVTTIIKGKFPEVIHYFYDMCYRKWKMIISYDAKELEQIYAKFTIFIIYIKIEYHSYLLTWWHILVWKKNKQTNWCFCRINLDFMNN